MSVCLRRALVVSVAVVVMALGAAGCGGGERAATGERALPGSPVGLPDVTVTDLATGEPVPLASVARPELPTLVWFWAPF